MTNFNLDQTFHTVFVDYGSAGIEQAALGPGDWSREAIIHDIAGGQYDHGEIIAIAEYNAAEGTSRDVTDDIRDEVRSLIVAKADEYFSFASNEFTLPDFVEDAHYSFEASLREEWA